MKQLITGLNWGIRVVWAYWAIAIWAVHGWMYGVGFAVLCVAIEFNSISSRRLKKRVDEMGRIFNILDRINK